MFGEYVGNIRVASGLYIISLWISFQENILAAPTESTKHCNLFQWRIYAEDV